MTARSYRFDNIFTSFQASRSDRPPDVALRQKVQAATHVFNTSIRYKTAYPQPVISIYMNRCMARNPRQSYPLTVLLCYALRLTLGPVQEGDSYVFFVESPPDSGHNQHASRHVIRQ